MQGRNIPSPSSTSLSVWNVSSLENRPLYRLVQNTIYRYFVCCCSFFSLRLSLIYWNLFLHHTHSSKVWEIHSSPFRLYWETVWHLFVGHNNKISPVQYKHWFALIVCGYCVCICRKLKSDCRINECRCPFSVCLFEHIVIVHFTIDTCYVYQYIVSTEHCWNYLFDWQFLIWQWHSFMEVKFSSSIPIFGWHHMCGLRGSIQFVLVRCWRDKQEE